MRPDLEFVDEAISGTRSDRNGLQKMLEAARSGRFNVLYLESLSRLARELVISLPLLKELVNVHGVRVLSTSEGLDSDVTGWELMSTFRSWMHAEYLKTLGAAVLRGQEHAVRNQYSAGDWCFGYGSEPIPGTEFGQRGRHAKLRMRVIVNEDNAEWVRRVFRWFVEDRRPISWIARKLTELEAPRDHRSTRPYWRHDNVRLLLGNRKYIGLWSWGKRISVRNPLTGRVHQEDRAEDGSPIVENQRPELRLISDEMFFKAQELLDDNQKRLGAVRNDAGRVRGSTKDLNNPRHLLQGLLKCAACGSTFKVTGANGKYLRCSGYAIGQCGIKTQLQRVKAEQTVLEAVSQQILMDSNWRAEVLALAQSEWAKRQSQPNHVNALEKQLAAVEERIKRLVDAIENGSSDPEVSSRLKERRDEREKLLQQLREQRQSQNDRKEPPTAEWVDQELTRLHEVLNLSLPAAGVALRNLLGRIEMTEMPIQGRLRRGFRGEIRIRRHAILDARSSEDPEGGTAKPISVEFFDPMPCELKADRAKELFDAGFRFEEIALELNCSRQHVTKVLQCWYSKHNQTMPDTRASRCRLKPTIDQVELQDRAKAYWDSGLQMQKIAEKLGCCRDTVTVLIRRWHRSRDLSVPKDRSPACPEQKTQNELDTE